jgi:hypothetical protein
MAVNLGAKVKNGILKEVRLAFMNIHTSRDVAGHGFK